jgi:hypothetical protein
MMPFIGTKPKNFQQKWKAEVRRKKLATDLKKEQMFNPKYASSLDHFSA